MNDYSKLRPNTNIERCECTSVSGLLLVYLFTRNPIHCSACRKEIDPERLGLTTSEVEEIASYMNVYASLYDLWLDSGEYEAFAKAKLIDPKGQVNRNGMALAEKLSSRWPSYYWWFYDTDDGTPAHCPSCSGVLGKSLRWGTGTCDHCHVIV
jgi:hypothetical protein